MKIFAIGDIHGEFDNLLEIEKKISYRVRNSENAKVIVLGDMIDRGPKSKEIIEYFKGNPFNGIETICLKGNHEDMLVQGTGAGSWRSSQYLKMWLENGGIETLESYGYDALKLNYNTPIDILKYIPINDIKWMHKLPIFHYEKEMGYYFVHAGVVPGIPLGNQKIAEQLWIRDKFMNSTDNHGAIIVHGHCPRFHIEHKNNRINLDTGSGYDDGYISCGVFEKGQKPEFFNSKIGG